MAMDMIDDELPEERKMNETKKIAVEADKLSREICPALIQRVVKEVA